MDHTRTLKVGDIAPDFSLTDQNERDFKLSDHQGRRVLLSFHPLAWTPVCAIQMKDLEQNRDAFGDLNAIAAGFSVDSVPCKCAWAKDLGISRTSLPCDFWPHGRVAHAYGIFDEAEGVSLRVNIVVDEKGKIAFIKIYPPAEVPDIAEVLAFLKDGR
jgi:peroxiredoxin